MKNRIFRGEDSLHSGEHIDSGGGGGYAPSIRRDEPVYVPESLSSNAAEGERYEYVILGAGCAGLSLCYYLLERGVEQPILLIDQKKEFADDRTWCFWDVEQTPFSHLSIKRWSSWNVHSNGRTVTQLSARHPYLCLAASDFYRHTLDRIASYGNVTLRLGESIEDCKEHEDEVFVSTSRGAYTSGHVFDGRGLPPGSPAFEEARKNAVWVPQKFLGYRLRTREPVFDPETCTLMDFSVSQRRGLRFVYVLPFSEREALVENVYLSDAEVSEDDHRSELTEYLSKVYGLKPSGYVVDGEERGYIPMTDYTFPRNLGERTYSIGMLGGESRPSTGYTFLRIQRYCRALAASVVAGRGAPKRVDAARYELLDRIFLRFMKEHPEKCPEVYGCMFAGLHPDTLVRFLTEKSATIDDLRLVMAMPKAPFLKVAARILGSKLRPRAG